MSTSVAATPSDFSNATKAISSAFSATYDAEEKGGNVSSLVSTLNQALALVQKAQSENTSNPSQASTDLENAAQLADSVSSQSVAIGQSGASAKSTVVMESVGSSVAIIVIALLVYIFGGQIYRKIWFRLYRSFIVRPV